jgi:uncharacterized protein (DUF1684 family)
MFRTHPQSPIPEGDRSSFVGLDLFPYSDKFRVLGTVEPVSETTLEIATSSEHPYSFTRFAKVHFTLSDGELSLELYWLDGYGGGLFLPFRDKTAGNTTYGAGRYLLDTVKGSDLGLEDGRLLLDFNFAYNPSCSYDARWVCPLAPSPNRLDIPIEAGERHVS